MTQELTREIEQLSEFNSHSCLFNLKGLGKFAHSILKNKHINNENSYDKIIDIYQGNPLYLEIIATIINKYFAGDAQLFLQNEQPFLADNLTSILQQKIEVLTILERQALELLAQEINPINWMTLQAKMDISASELIRILESLERRSCLETIKNKVEIIVKIDSMLRKYLEI